MLNGVFGAFTQSSHQQENGSCRDAPIVGLVGALVAHRSGRSLIRPTQGFHCPFDGRVCSDNRRRVLGNEPVSQDLHTQNCILRQVTLVMHCQSPPIAVEPHTPLLQDRLVRARAVWLRLPNKRHGRPISGVPSRKNIFSGPCRNRGSRAVIGVKGPYALPRVRHSRCASYGRYRRRIRIFFFMRYADCVAIFSATSLRTLPR